MQRLLNEIGNLAQYVRSLDYARRSNTLESVNTPASDRYNSGALLRHSMADNGRLRFGAIVDVMPGMGWYKVLPEKGGPIPCCVGSVSGRGPMATKQIEELQPDDFVWFVEHPEDHIGIIIAIEPNYLYDGRLSLGDYLFQGSNVGIQTDHINRQLAALPESGLIDWSAHAPKDSLNAGGRGFVSPTGGAVFLDSFMAFLRSDEDCGFWAFYHDSLARIHGHNLQIRSNAMELESLDDENENTHFVGYNTYPWEVAGGYDENSELYRDVSASDSQLNKAWEGVIEPRFDDQQAFFRTQEWHGYLANAIDRTVALRPFDEPEDGVYRRSVEQTVPGVFRESVDLDGGYAVTSAKHVFLTKKLVNPVAYRRKLAEDATGDNTSNYRPSGLPGSGAAHTLNGQVARNDNNETAYESTLGFLDVHAHRVNWEHLVGFAKHEQDFFLPEEEAIADSWASNKGWLGALSFNSLATQSAMSPPDAIEKEVDHRETAVQYFPNFSYLGLLDDGGVVIGDGYGSEIRMCGGNIDISCPGDISLRAGRRVVTLAGSDAITRAKKNAEISTTEGDIRARAGKSTYLMSERGTLIESRSPCSAYNGWRDVQGTDVVAEGVVIKTADSGFAVLANEVYLRAGVEGDGDGIHLDAGAGLGRITSNSLTWTRFIGQEAQDYFGVDSPEAANIFSASFNIFGACLCVNGDITAVNNIVAGEWLAAATGHVSTGLADSYYNVVPQVLPSIVTSVTDCETSAVSAVEAGASNYGDVYTERLYSEQGPGSAENMDAIAFTFRSEAQYGTTNYIMFESRWQQLARLGSGGGTAWVETGVSGAVVSYPFPGLEPLTVGSSGGYRTQDLNLIDVENGVATNRSGDSYVDAEYATQEQVAINSGYLVIDVSY